MAEVANLNEEQFDSSLNDLNRKIDIICDFLTMWDQFQQRDMEPEVQDFLKNLKVELSQLVQHVKAIPNLDSDINDLIYRWEGYLK